MSSAERKERLARLKTATKQYIEKELERIDRDVLFLEQAKAGRGSGGTAQKQAASAVATKAASNLEWYLKGL